MIIGIDLGTTNSLCAVWRDGQTQLIPNSLGDHLTPSVVGLDDNGEVLVGRVARERLVTHPSVTTSAFKRYMGSERTISLGTGRVMRPEELSALVLRALKQDAEAYLGETVTEAVITVPAYFSDAQRQATRIAGELAGLKVERLLNEPTAAALAYGLHEKDVESQFLVFDLGGGTFDVSVLELFDGIMEVHASAGDNFLGGEDFVSVLAEAFCKHHGIDYQRLTNDRQRAIREAAERCKRQLSSDKHAIMEVRLGEQLVQWSVSESDFERISDSLLQRLRNPVERALRDANIRASELDAVVLIGGSTRKPIIQRLVTRMFGQLPLRHINPDEAVALGAAVQAGLKARDAALSEVVLTDVCPYTLGYECSNEIAQNQYEHHVFAPLIERNTVIPVSRVETLYPLHDRQREVRLRIFQGESRMVTENVFLGEIKIPLPRGKREECGVDVRYTYDINGLLEVIAKVQQTEQSHNLVIEQNPGSMSAKEIQQRLQKLEALKVHPRDQAENQVLVNRAKRLFEETLGEMRESVGQAIGDFDAVLQRQDPQEISRVRVQFKEYLDQIEGESYL